MSLVDGVMSDHNVLLGMTMVRHDNGRNQKQHQLRFMKDNKLKRTCDTSRKKDSLVFVHIALIIVIVLAFGGWMWNFSFGWINILGKDNPSIGEFGDIFGVANSAFTGLAFIGVIYSVLLQRKELEKIKEERDDTRQILEDQQENLSRQRFETTFYQLFAAFNDIVDKTHVHLSEQTYYDYIYDREREVSEQTATGRDAYRLLVLRLNILYSLQAKIALMKTYGLPDGHGGMFLGREFIDNSELPWINVNSYIAAYERLTGEYNADLGRYFRSLYTMMNFVAKQDLPSGEAKFYYKLIRAQLSSHEATLLALNSFSGNSTAKFNDLLFEFGMLKNAMLLDPVLDAFGAVLPHMAFGNNYSKDMEDNSDDHFPDAMPKELIINGLAEELAGEKDFKLWKDLTLSLRNAGKYSTDGTDAKNLT